MKKRLIVTIMLGKDPSFEFVKRSFKEYAKKVKEMREAQIQYFVSRKSPGLKTIAESWLKKSKALEKAVDEATGKILAGVEQKGLF